MITATAAGVAPPPASGAWREGEHEPGRRRFLRLDRPVRLEAGDQLPEVTVAYETWGELNARRDNAVLVLHALTGDSHLAGSAEPGHPTAGWWDALVGPGSAIDTGEWSHPDCLGSLLVLAVGAYATADQIGLQSAQIHAIRADRRFNSGDYYEARPGHGPYVGLGTARRLAHLSYRGEQELAQRFGRLP